MTAKLGQRGGLVMQFHPDRPALLGSRLADFGNCGRLSRREVGFINHCDAAWPPVEKVPRIGEPDLGKLFDNRLDRDLCALDKGLPQTRYLGTNEGVFQLLNPPTGPRAAVWLAAPMRRFFRIAIHQEFPAELALQIVERVVNAGDSFWGNVVEFFHHPGS